MVRRFTLAALSLALSSCTVSAPGPAEDARAAASAVQRASVPAMPADTFGPLVSRRAIHGGRSSFASFEFKKGAVIAEHRHPNEQTTYVLSGGMVFDVAGKRHELSAGDVLIIPPDVPHSARALEDTVEIDFFTPERRDWIEGGEAPALRPPEPRRRRGPHDRRRHPGHRAQARRRAGGARARAEPDHHRCARRVGLLRGHARRVRLPGADAP